MILITNLEGGTRIVLDDREVEYLKQGGTVTTADGKVVLGWSPDIQDLANHLFAANLTADEIDAACRANLNRPNTPATATPANWHLVAPNKES